MTGLMSHPTQDENLINYIICSMRACFSVSNPDFFTFSRHLLLTTLVTPSYISAPMTKLNNKYVTAADSCIAIIIIIGILKEKDNLWHVGQSSSHDQ